LQVVEGFSKFTKQQRVDWIAAQLKGLDYSVLKDFWLADDSKQKVFDDFSENTITNFFLPYGLAPNFKINDKSYTVPMVIEESSVVAAAARSAKFWYERGGFKTQVMDIKKIGHVHFLWKGSDQEIQILFNENKTKLLSKLRRLDENMRERGGGILDLELKNRTQDKDHYYQLEMTFNTCDAMGANFINTILEDLAAQWVATVGDNNVRIIMSILSNYTPECKVKAWVECPVSELGSFAENLSAQDFAEKFVEAVSIAQVDVSRAVTHNKGILNGIDSVVIATGNDFRATSACAHAYAARDGQYRSLSEAKIEAGVFKFSLEIPLALGTVGGLTRLHPLAHMSLSILDNPTAAELMSIVASVGLAQNFAAIRSLITTGIQQGHMKMHLLNILNQLCASQEQVQAAKKYFVDKIVSFASVREFLTTTDLLQ
jgi:hydroxymethylglutaryl-CoA reductase